MSELSSTQPRFERNEMVRLRSDPSEAGVVREILRLADGGYQYRVFFSIEDQQYVAEDDLLPLVERLLDEETFDHRRHLDDLRRELLLAKLRTPHGESLFSLHASRVEFHPYQFKPVLKLLRQPDQRLLIADEVGLGKTIEAGIILTELQARLDLQRVLVICPAALKLKWRDEMRSRFEEEFEILDAQRLRQFLNEYSRVGMAARTKAIVSLELIRRPEFLERLAADRTQFDLVVIDEAHHIRNRATRAHELASVVSDNADALLLLTATPLNLGRPDLFHLLQVLSPGEFDDFGTFEDQIEPNRYVTAASRLVQQHRPNDALETLVQVESTGQRARFAGDPYYREVKELLSGPELSRDSAVRVQRGLLELNSLAHVFTRTKKREVMENAPLRDARTIEYRFTPEEQAFYDATVKFVRQHWRDTQNQPWGVGFALVTRERQAASCLPAFREHYASAMTQVYSTPEDLSMAEGLVADGEAEEDIQFTDAVRDAAKELDAAAVAFGNTDTKFARFLDVLRSVLEEEPESKILVFSFFKKTLEYLQMRIAREGINTSLIYGDVDVLERTAIVEQFQNSEDIRVLLSSEVGSEGLDFQFCHVLFNYDLPWNPMKVEQRIGRIDRFGQKSPRISIYNFIAAGTIEDRIFNRLYTRIRIFQESIGDLEEILGDVMRELTHEIYTKELTPEEERQLADQAANAVLRRKQEMEEFEETKDEFLGQDAIFFQDLSDAEAAGRFVSPEEIRALVMGYLGSEFPRSQLRKNVGDRTWHMIPDVEFHQAIRRYVLQFGSSDYSQYRFLERLRPGKMLPVTFTDDIAYERKLVEFLTIRHPITRAAIEHWEKSSPRDAPVMIAHVGGSETILGDFFFFVFLLGTKAIRFEQRLVPVLVSSESLQVDDVAGREFFRTLQTCEEARPGHIDGLGEEGYLKASEIALRYMGGVRADIEAETRRLNDARVNARRFAVEQTFEAKIRRVEEALEKVRESRIRRMRSAQLENLRVDLRSNLDDIESRREVAVTYGLEMSGFVTFSEGA